MKPPAPFISLGDAAGRVIAEHKKERARARRKASDKPQIPTKPDLEPATGDRRHE